MKKILVVIVTVLLLVGMVACSQESPADNTDTASADTSSDASDVSDDTTDNDEPLVIRALWCTMAAPSVKAGDEGAAAMAKELGVDYLGLDAEFDVQKQVDQAMNLISQGVDGIILNPIDQTSYGAVVKAIEDAGIPLVVFAQRLEESAMESVISYVGGDEVAVGEACGRSMEEALGGSGNVVIVEGAPGSAPQIGRTQGFENIINANPNITILEKQGCPWDREEALAITEDFLTKYDNIDGIFCHDDHMGLGVYEAVKAAGKLDEIKLVFFNGTKEVIDLVKAGEVYSTITQPIRWGGGKSVEALVDYINGREVEAWYPDYNEPITIENADSVQPEW